jgi:hypothetical protein
MHSYGSSALHFYLMRSFYQQNFMLISLIVLELCPGQSLKCKNEQMAIIPKLGKAELRLFRIALLLNEIYLSTIFLVDTSQSYVPDNFTVKNWKRAITPK